MKVQMDYEFNAKITNTVDLEKLSPSLSYKAFVEKVNNALDDSIRQFLADELAESNQELVTVKRISLNISEVE